MITLLLDLDGVRGDTLLRTIFLTYQGQPMTQAQLQQLASQFTRLDFQIRDEPDDLAALVAADSTDGAVRWDFLPNPFRSDAPQGCLVLEVPAEKMAAVNDKAFYDIQLTEPRSGDLGDLVWTRYSGRFTPLKDVSRATS